MNYILKVSCLFIGVFFMSCGTQKNKESNSVNTSFNSKYSKSRKSFEGDLSGQEYYVLKTKIEKELGVKIPRGKSILINYKQYGSNCFSYGLSRRSKRDIAASTIRISSRMSKEYNAEDFFVYSNNALNKECYEDVKDYKLDSGFFKDLIFTLEENCTAFFIVKPNGNFLKYYGEDYFTEVKNFLKE